tara:strand:+ start:2531 stop:4099 length:1569 start_codon:yes stop_codon:yes gene_type:complete
MFSKKFNYKNLFYLLFLILFSFLINQYYASRGVFPIDTFFHFDNSFRILKGEIPFNDFWIVSSVFLNYLQAAFFYILGASWKSYILHASLINVLITLSTFFVLKQFYLKIDYCFLYSLLFSILAYPSSGTPFVDHHSAFFSLLAFYCLALGINTNKKIYWVLIPFFSGFAFLSKQVPAIYVILSIILVLVFYSYNKKSLRCIIYSLIGTIIFLLLIFVFGASQKINLIYFLDQYIFYPQTIGNQRFQNLDFSFKGVIDHFKFIYLAIIPLLFLNCKKFLMKKKYIETNDFLIFFSLLLLTFSLIFHQLLTKNQTFIFFLIPILSAFSHASFYNTKLKYKRNICYLIIFICLFATLKYHLRFNENRKFHELTDVNLNISVDASKIHKKLSGLKWITPEYKDQPQKEIDYINKIQSHLANDKRNKMVITNYLFFSSLLDEKLHMPSLAMIDNTTHPMKNSKYFMKFKKLMVRSIKKNNISVIYLAGTSHSRNIFDYLDKDCFEEFLINEKLKSFELKDCTDINQ